MIPGLDAIAVMLTVIGTLVLGKKKIWGWPIYMVANVLWIVYFIPKGENNIILMNIFFLALNAWSWYNWNKVEKECAN